MPWRAFDTLLFPGHLRECTEDNLLLALMQEEEPTPASAGPVASALFLPSFAPEVWIELALGEGEAQVRLRTFAVPGLCAHVRNCTPEFVAADPQAILNQQPPRLWEERAELAPEVREKLSRSFESLVPREIGDLSRIGIDGMQSFAEIRTPASEPHAFCASHATAETPQYAFLVLLLEAAWEHLGGEPSREALREVARYLGHDLE